MNMKTFAIRASFFFALVAGSVYGQVHGDLIFAPANTSAVATTNSVSVSPMNAVDGDLVGFDKLAGFNLSLTSELEFNTNRPAWADAQVNAMIPTNIFTLQNHDVAVTGFMIPMHFKGEKVIEFMLARDPPACCFATMPQIHEWVSVRVKSPGVKPMEYAVVRARGILNVGAERKDGALTSVYRMEAEAVSEEK
jgi:hypothetical protein